MLVKDVMSERVIAVTPENTVSQAVKVMVENKISGLAVSVDNKAAGVITLSDIFRKVVYPSRSTDSVRIGDIMSKPVITCHTHDSIEAVAGLMKDHKIKRVVVVNPSNVVSGIVTAMDVVSKVPEMLDVMFTTWVKPGWR